MKTLDPTMLERTFKFTSKAGTLESLKGMLSISKLCEQRTVSWLEWKAGKSDVLKKAISQFENAVLIVRSSASTEDTMSSSMAGAHLSIAHVDATSEKLVVAIDQVFKSYSELSDIDEVLIQPMVSNVAISGVVLTRDLDTGSPYYVINYDDLSGRTDTVTGGHASKTVMVRRGAETQLRSKRMLKLLDCIIEIESVTAFNELDIEFCINDTDEIFILQVRPLSAREKWHVINDDTIHNAVNDIRHKISATMTPEPNIAGRTTILTEMTDWNPAEMIGNTPRPLALSLYKSLITDSVWAKARDTMGYRMVDGPLLIDFYGRPYIDVRKSFNSFLQSGIPNDIAEKLVNHQLNMLAENRELHDKVEFDICVTCWDFCIEESRHRFNAAGLSPDEVGFVEQALLALTKNILVKGVPALDALIQKSNVLLQFETVDLSKSPQERVQHLLSACRDQGTLIFSQLARHGFIGIQFLRSMVQMNIIDETESAHFLRSITTVATELSDDLGNVFDGKMARSTFLQQYGHLRPGTYDITSWRYDEKPDLYLARGNAQPTRPTHEVFEFSPASHKRIETHLSQIGYDITSSELLGYIALSIKGREQAKFAFTRVVSDILTELASWGEEVSLTRDQLSFIPIETVFDASDSAGIMKRVALAQERYKVTRAIRLPHIIVTPNDIDVVRLPIGQPTFITNQSVTANISLLTTAETHDIDGRIILIESADPGFDWIFSHPISGLITKFGGANSHMAIRCAEFGLPAAIGCGERLFDLLSKAKTVELNAATKRLGVH
mgnify:FL=1